MSSLVHYGRASVWRATDGYLVNSIQKSCVIPHHRMSFMNAYRLWLLEEQQQWLCLMAMIWVQAIVIGLIGTWWTSAVDCAKLLKETLKTMREEKSSKTQSIVTHGKQASNQVKHYLVLIVPAHWELEGETIPVVDHVYFRHGQASNQKWMEARAPIKHWQVQPMAVHL